MRAAGERPDLRVMRRAEPRRESHDDVPKYPVCTVCGLIMNEDGKADPHSAQDESQKYNASEGRGALRHLAMPEDRDQGVAVLCLRSPIDCNTVHCTHTLIEGCSQRYTGLALFHQWLVCFSPYFYAQSNA